MNQKVCTAYVGLGSNRGDRRAQIEGAVRALDVASGVDVVRVSPLVETEPVGGPPNQRWYLNGVVELHTSVAAQALLTLLQSIESRFGRDRAQELPNGSRTLDLDLLTCGDERIRDERLVLPHPRLELRVFVLEPLATLAPERVLAGCGQTVRERLAYLRSEVAS